LLAFLFYIKTVIHVLPWKICIYNEEACDTITCWYPAASQRCYVNLPVSLSPFFWVYIDTRNMSGRRERENIIDKHNIKRKSKQTVRLSCILSPLVFAADANSNSASCKKKKQRNILFFFDKARLSVSCEWLFLR
jgi:hypothetical protein